MHLAAHIHEYLILVPLPLAEATHTAHTLSADITDYHRNEPVPPMAYGLVKDVDATLCQKFFNAPQV